MEQGRGKTLRVAVAEEDRIFRAEAVRMVEEIFAERREGLSVKEFISARGLLSDLAGGCSYDLYLLRVEMPVTDGLTMAEAIRRRDEDAYIIFLASHEHYAVRSYAYQASGYVLKSQYRTELPRALRRVKQRLASETTRYYIVEGQNYYRFRVDDILYLDKAGKNTVFHCTNGRIYKDRITLKSARDKLADSRFVNIHRCQIVNLDHVTAVVNGQVVLSSQECLYVTPYLIPEIKKNILKCWHVR